jgi:hypothetical protein
MEYAETLFCQAFEVELCTSSTQEPLYSDRPIAHQERSPFTPNTKHYDDCTKIDGPSRIKSDGR